MKNKIKIIFSVDDGGINDMELAKMLKKYRIPAVFYIPTECDLTEEQIKYLATGKCKKCKKERDEWLFEVGGHTKTHPQDLKKLDDEELFEEINSNKLWLERITGKKITKFCYPRGRYDDRVIETVKKCGYKEARTTLVNHTEFPDNPFKTHTSIHVHPERPEYGDKSWIELGAEMLDDVCENGGRFEIWGHSREIYEKFNQEEFLDDFLYRMRLKMNEINYN